MWRWPLSIKAFILGVLCFIPFALSETKTLHTSIGPTSQEEQEFLWKEGEQAFEKGDFKGALRPLERLIHRYTASPNHLKAHLLLGKSYLRTHMALQAISPLKFYVEATGRTEGGLRSRLLLSQAYLESGKTHQALLSAQEVLKTTRPPSQDIWPKDIWPKDIWIEGLLQKSLAQIKLGQDPQALLVLDLAKTKLIEQEGLNPLKGKASWIELLLKTRACARLANKNIPLQEGQVRDQLERRGICLTEALILFLGVLQSLETNLADSATQEILQSFKNYSQVCTHPPGPPGRRTPKQLKTYHLELQEILAKDCKLKHQKAFELLSSLKNQVPPAMQSHIETVLKGTGT